jgi:hypothetical protein
MQELKRWIKLQFGKPTMAQTKSVKQIIDRTSFASTRGVIAFDIHFNDAAGHLDLWDGATFIHEVDLIFSPSFKDYFELANKVVLWRC